MAKKRTPFPPYRKGGSGRQFNFDDLATMSSTIDETENLMNESASGSVKRGNGQTIELSPPFKEPEDNKNSFVSLRDLNLTYKICGIIAVVVIPLTIYISKMDTNVTDLKTDVKEIKTKIEKLNDNTLINTSRIDTIEKTADNYKNPAKK